MSATNLNDLLAGLDPSVMAEISGAQLLQLIQEATPNFDRGLIICKDDLPTVAEITASVRYKKYVCIKDSDNPKVIYGFDVDKFNANTDPPWTAVSSFVGAITNAMLAGGIQLGKLSIDPAVPGDSGKYVVVNGAGTGYVHQAFALVDGSIVIAKLSVSGGIANQFIKIKADSSGWEFISPNDIPALLSDNTIAVSKLNSSGNNANTSALFAKVMPATSSFLLDILRAFDINAVGVPVGYQIVSDGAKGVWAERVTAGGSYFLLCHSEAQNTGAGNAPALSTNAAINWFTRVLNLESVDSSAVVSLNVGTYVFTLQAGTYRISIQVPGYQIDESTARLYNITDAGEQAGVICKNAYGQNNAGDHVNILSGEFTIASAKDFRVEQACKSAGSGNGLGIPNNIFGRSEIYTVVEGWKVA